MTAPIEYILPNLDFKHLPAFALYIKEKKLSEFVQLQLQFSKEYKLPLLQFFNWMTETEMLEISKIECVTLLTFLAENDAKGMIENATKRWVQNQLPLVGKNNIDTTDLSLIIYIRKKTFLKLVPGYTNDLSTALELVDEIDQCSIEQQSASLKTYIQLLNEKISEHVHFIAKVTATTPAITYVFDLAEHKEIYINNKLKELLGYTDSDLQLFENGVLAELLHPDDLTGTMEYATAFKDLKDGEIRSCQYRFKHKNGSYIWMRDYGSVFRRTPAGEPWQIIGIALDADAEKKAADQLQQREEQLLEAQQMAQLGSYTWNVTNHTTTTTPQLLEILSLNTNEPFENFFSHIHSLDREMVRGALNKAIEAKNGYEMFFRYLANAEEKVIWSRGKAEVLEGNTVVRGTVMDITDQHLLMQQIKQSEKLYKQAEALTHIGNWKWNIKENKVEWSDEMFRIHTLEPQSEEVDFEKVLSFIHPEDKQILVDVVSRSLQLSQPYETFYRLLLPNEEIKYLQAKGEVIAGESGKPEFLFGTGQDITEQYTTQMLLEENQKYLEKITNAAPFIMIAYNVQSHKYNFVSKGVENILGYNQKQVLKQGAALLGKTIHPDDLTLVTGHYNNAIAIANQSASLDKKDIITDFRYRVLHTNGQYKWLKTYSTILDRDNDEKVEHLLSISIDITEEVEAEQKIKEQEYFIQSIADASPAILYVFDLEKNRIVYINKEVHSVLNFTTDEIVNFETNFFKSIFHPDDFEKLYQEHGKLVSGNEHPNGIEYEVRMKHKTQGWRYVLLKEIIFKRDEETGEVKQVLCAVVDITERKEMEKSLYDKTIELHQSNKSLEEFAYVASHDLKEPLRKISAFGDRLISSQQDRLDNNGTFFLSKIIDSSKRMNTMIDDLLSLSMISNEKEFEDYSLQTVLDEVIQTLEFKIEKRKAIITADSLPTVKIVPSQFRQLFQNLLSNALKFIAEGTQPQINITCKTIYKLPAKAKSVATASPYLQLQFIDNGIGFEQEYADKIFVVFQRLHGRSEYDGTGIGLAICKKIMENHSGVIYANGTPGKGATFTVEMPA